MMTNPTAAAVLEAGATGSPMPAMAALAGSPAAAAAIQAALHDEVARHDVVLLAPCASKSDQWMDMIITNVEAVMRRLQEEAS